MVTLTMYWEGNVQRAQIHSLFGSCRWAICKLQSANCNLFLPRSPDSAEVGSVPGRVRHMDGRIQFEIEKVTPTSHLKDYSMIHKGTHYLRHVFATVRALSDHYGSL
jgi:hypothetical protein